MKPDTFSEAADGQGASQQRQPGCLAGFGAAVGIAVLAPMALIIRSVRQWRRGTSTRYQRTDSDFGGGLTRVDLSIDVVSAGVEAFRPLVTDVVVRVAEALRRPDDVYHMVYRDAAAGETLVIPVGPQLQELGERFHLTLSQGSLAGRTAVWFTLDRGGRVVDFVDPVDYDPEAEGEPEGLLARSGMRWGMATSFASDGVSTLHRVVLFVPADSVGKVNAVLHRLQP